MGLMKRLGLTVPIFQAPMAGVATPALAAAVSDAGGLGGLGIGTGTLESARSMITETQRLTSRPFNVNLFVHRTPKADARTESAWLDFLRSTCEELGVKQPDSLPPSGSSFLDSPGLLDLLLELRPSVVSFHFGLPPGETIRRLRDIDAVLMATATNMEELRQIERAELDAVIAQGAEAGGHRGVFDPSAEDGMMSTLDLVRHFAQRTSLPIIAAGGLMDGRDIRAALDAGATAAQLGTAFIPCPESSVDDAYRQALKQARPEDTTFTTLVSGRPARGIKNRFTQLQNTLGDTIVPDFPLGYGLTKMLSSAGKQKGVEAFEVRWAGTEAARSRVMPARELIEVLRTEIDTVREVGR